MTLRDLRLDDDTTDSAVTIVSELSTNVFAHVFGGENGSPSLAALAGRPELWGWLWHDPSSRSGLKIEWTVFDADPTWKQAEYTDQNTDAGSDELLLEGGRGLDIVDALSNGQCGHRVSRSRLRTPAITGKAAWFILDLPASAHLTDPCPAHPLSSDVAARRLARCLNVRRIPQIIRRDKSGTSRVVITDDLAVRCTDGVYAWTVGDTEHRVGYRDLAEADERVVCAYLEEKSEGCS